jgi:hypothetical protein
MSIMQVSNEYWEKRNPYKCFKVFLMSLLRRCDIPWLCLDIRKLLFQYLTRYIQFHHNKLGKWNPIYKISKEKICKVTELNFVDPITYIISANTMQCSHISATGIGKDSMHVKMAFNIMCQKVANKLIQIEEKVKMSLEEILRKKLSSDDWRPTIKKDSGKYILFFAKYCDTDYNINLKRHYEDKPYTKLDSFHFDERRYRYDSKISKQNWKLINVNNWVNFDFLFTVCAVSKNRNKATFGGVHKDSPKRWSLRFRIEPKLPFWLEID